MTRKTLFAVIAVVVALAIATVLWVNRSGSVDPVSSPTPAVSKALEPTPTPDPREAAVAEAEAAYQNYSDAITAMSKGKGDRDLMMKVRPYTTEVNWETVKKEAAYLRDLQPEVTGELKVHFLKAQDIRLDSEPPNLNLKVCLDLRSVETRNVDGKKINVNWIESKIRMLKGPSGWQVDRRDEQVQDKSCAR